MSDLDGDYAVEAEGGPKVGGRTEAGGGTEAGGDAGGEGEGEVGHSVAVKEEPMDHQDTPAPRNRLEFDVISLNIM